MPPEAQSAPATLPQAGEVFVALPEGGLATAKKLEKEDFAPGAYEKYQQLLKDRGITGDPVVALDSNDRDTQPSVKMGMFLGSEKTVLLINSSEFQASPEYFRKLEIPQAKLDGLVAAHALTDAERGSHEDRKHYEEFKVALQAIGADPATKLYINNDKHPGDHMPIASGITKEGVPYVVAYEKDIKHWNAEQLEGLLGHDAVHVRDGDIKPERQAAVFNDKTHKLSRDMEAHADREAAQKLGHPEAMAQALQIGLDLQLQAYRKETHKSDDAYFKEMNDIDPFHDPIKQRIDTLNAMAATTPAKQR